jgi:hypothetical protein
MPSTKDWSTNGEMTSFKPHQSQKSKTHLSEMPLLEHEMLMWRDTGVLRVPVNQSPHVQ